jgi:hypothetical protein
MEDKDVKIAGFVWKKDFPKAEQDFKRKDLGTSMELADVYVKNEHANIWELNDFEFTGATILKRNAAAYTKTSLSAAAKAAVLGEEGENNMSKKVRTDDKKRKVAAAGEHIRSRGNGDLALMTQAISGSFTSALGPLVSEIKASNQAVLDSVEELKGLHLIQAAAQPQEDESDDEVVMHAAEDASDESSDDMAAAHDSDDMAAASDDSDDMAAAQFGSDGSASDASSDQSDASDASELAAMEDLELDHPDESTGEVNKDATNKGHKTSVTKPPKQGEHFKGNVAKGRLHSAAKKGNGMKKPFPGLEAAADKLRTVYASNRKLKHTIKAMGNKYGKKLNKLQAAYAAQEERLEFFTDREARRSAMPTELINLAAKSGVNLGELKAAGQSLTVTQVDHLFATAKMQGINIDPEQRIAMKMQLEQEGLMDNGEITRNYGRA